MPPPLSPCTEETSLLTSAPYGTFEQAIDHLSRATPDRGSHNYSPSPTMASYDESGGDAFTKSGDVTIGSIAGDEARQGTDREHSLSFMEAIRLYPSAVGWTIYFSLGVR
jgi:hypothetical protein